jgi:hypothetical protein
MSAETLACAAEAWARAEAQVAEVPPPGAGVVVVVVGPVVAVAEPVVAHAAVAARRLAPACVESVSSWV